MKDHRKLAVWREAHDLRIRIYQLTRGDGLLTATRQVHQIRASSASIADNIAEGHSSGTTANEIRYVSIALGSCAEVDSQLAWFLDAGLLDLSKALALTDDLSRLRRRLQAFQLSLKQRHPQ